MTNKEQPSSLCKSVFKSSDNTISKSQFTQKWIELINQLEKHEEITIGQKSAHRNRGLD